MPRVSSELCLLVHRPISLGSRLSTPSSGVDDVKRIELVKLFGGSISVRLDGMEAAIIPRKSESSMYELEKAFNKVISEVEVEVVEAEREEWE